MTRHCWTICLMLLVLAFSSDVFAQPRSSIRISDSQRLPEVKPIPANSEPSNHISRTVQYQTAFSKPPADSPKIPAILTGKTADAAPSTGAPNVPSVPSVPSAPVPQLNPASVDASAEAATIPAEDAGDFQANRKASGQANAFVPIANADKFAPHNSLPATGSTSSTMPATTAGPAYITNDQLNTTNRQRPATGPTYQSAVSTPTDRTATGNPQGQSFAPAKQSAPPSQFSSAQNTGQFAAAPSSDNRVTNNPGTNGNWNGGTVSNSVRTEVRSQPSQSPVADSNQSSTEPRTFEVDSSFVNESRAGTPGTSNHTQHTFESAAPVSSPAAIPMPQRHGFVPHRPAHEIDASQAANKDSLMTLQTSSPLVRVATTGPKSVSVNKVSTYKVNVTNLGSAASGSLLIAVDIPGHVELDDADLSSGTPEVEESDTSTRILWTLENVHGQSEENMLVKVIPRQPLPFDLEVEWTFVPFSKGARVQVTEPRLTMDISGPSEVKYGEKAIYTITLNNPGTGDAEDVVVALSDSLGGEQATVGTIKPGDRKQFEVELIARDAGKIDLGATVTADGEIRVPAVKPITVRRARLEVVTEAPNYRYAGSDITYQITVANAGDAVASNVLAAIALPKGAEYISGIEGAVLSEQGDALRWNIGTMTAGAQKTYRVRCLLTQPGTARLEAGARGDEQLADSSVASTRVDALADLTLTVVDPRGPQQVGDEVVYQITVENRGTKEATNVKLVGQFSPGIEPTRTEGLKSQVVPGSVAFETIPSIPVGRKIALKLYAKASDKGTHTFRAELNCVDQDIRRVFEGTTKYFVVPELQKQDAPRMSEGTLDNGFSR